ncbi:MAG: hypothetical protein ACWA44_02110 [Thiotrichales bacterium]
MEKSLFAALGIALALTLSGCETTSTDTPDGSQNQTADLATNSGSETMDPAESAEEPGQASNPSPPPLPESNLTQIPTDTTVTKPDYLSSYVDPVFGSKVTRITDRTRQTGNAQPYPKQGSAWNSDGSIIRLQYRLYDAATFIELPLTKDKDIDAAYAAVGSPQHGAGDIRWSNTSPDVMYVLDSSQRFIRLTLNADKSTAARETLIDLSALGFEDISIGNNEGNLDFANTRVVFAAKKPGDENVYALLYQLGDNTLTWTKTVPHGLWNTTYGNPDYFDWISIDSSGEYLVLNATDRIFVYDINLENEVLLSNEGSHGDIGIDANGDPVYVQFEFNGEQGIWSYNLRSHQALKLLPRKYNGGHVSCRNDQRPGWCYLSTIEEGYREVFAVKLDGSGIVNRFAQTHTSDGYSSLGTPSSDGREMIFQSDWGDAATVSETYHVEFE